MWETVIVWIVVGGVAAMAIRSFIKALSNEDGGCGSSGCCGCTSHTTGCRGDDDDASDDEEDTAKDDQPQ